MVKEYNYINIREALSRVLRHPLLQDVTLEQAVQYTIDFIGIFGLPKLYQDKEEVLHIEDFRAKLPCGLISINQIKEYKPKSIKFMCIIAAPEGVKKMQEEHAKRAL